MKCGFEIGQSTCSYSRVECKLLESDLLTTWKRESQALMLDKKAFPRPCMRVTNEIYTLVHVHVYGGHLGALCLL